jgi:dTDP-4-dehydrorhamnose reductase
MSPAPTPRVLIFGGAGMLGHKVWQVFRDRFDTWVTIRGDAPRANPLLSGDQVIHGVTAEDTGSLSRAWEIADPTVVVNCIGIVKQLAAASDPIASLTVNSLLPHRLAAMAARANARMIHISTDCVFSGRGGRYREDDLPDAQDLYGRTKLLGEVTGPACLTIRTSIVGRELSATTGLLEWFLGQHGRRLNGYTSAWFSGLTTAALADLLADAVESHPGLEGLYHVASEPISKYDLLCRLNQAYGAGAQIEPSDEVRIDRTLDGSRFRVATATAPARWDDMIAGLVADPTPYNDWRRQGV